MLASQVSLELSRDDAILALGANEGAKLRQMHQQPSRVPGDPLGVWHAGSSL